MDTISQEIKAEITKANKILVTAHIRPDWDAMAGALMTYDLLKTNFPEKELRVNIESWTMSNTEFLPLINDVTNHNTTELLESFSPELLIIVDVPTLSRTTFSEQQLKEHLDTHSDLTTICIDHHPLQPDYHEKIIFNNGANAGVEEIYKCLVREIDLKESKNTALYLGVGIMGDTNRFMFFLNKDVTQTFEYMAYAIKQEVVPEILDRLMNKITLQHVTVITEMLNNMKITDDLIYSYVTDKFYNEHPEIPLGTYVECKELLTLQYFRTLTTGITFLLFPEPGGFKGSIRIQGPEYDARVFAKYLNGAGHRPASGFRLTEPKSMDEALEIVLKVMKEHRDEARINDLKT